MEKINSNNPLQELKKLRWERDFSHNWNILKNPDILKQMNKLTLNSKEDEEEYIIKQKGTNASSLMKLNINFNFNFLRNLIIVIDMSDNLNAMDYKPNRHKYLFKELEWFVNEYFKYNIASSVVILANRNYKTQLISPFSNNLSKIIKNLTQDIKPEGSFSITNSLRVIIYS